MQKSKTYRQAKFQPDVLRAAVDRLVQSASLQTEESTLSTEFRVYSETGESWVHDTEAEFFSDYRRDHDQSRYNYWFSDSSRRPSASFSIRVSFTYGKTEVSVEGPTRGIIESVFQIFDDAEESSRLPVPPEPESAPPRPTIFIGHGRSPQWRDLKDHLAEKHGYSVQAYETGARAGHAIRDILDEMVRTSSFALLVLTGEDETATGETRARQNVVHELGLFQGKLGFARAIALLGDGTEEFSNIHGINQLRFSKGNVREVFGDVVATLRREFES